MNKILKTGALGLLLSIPAVLAQEEDAIAVGFLAGLGASLIVLVIIAIAVTVFWILMLVDCIKRDFDQKTLWIILLILFGFLAAVLYYFMVKRKSA